MSTSVASALKADVQPDLQKGQDHSSATAIFNEAQRPTHARAPMSSPLSFQHPDEDHAAVDQYVFKVLVVGDTGCGKTSFIQRYCRDVFNTSYKATIGVDFALKDIRWNKTTAVRLQLWDIAGQERFGHMTRVYYKEAVGAFIVYDVTRPTTFDAVAKWKKDIDQCLDASGLSIPVVVLANKCDLSEQPVDREKLDQFCQDNNCVGWLATSAKANTNIEAAGTLLVRTMLELETGGNATDDDSNVVDLSQAPTEQKKKSGCLNC